DSQRGWLNSICGVIRRNLPQRTRGMRDPDNGDRIRGRHGMTYMGSEESARQLADYRPLWLDHLADDVTIEGSAMDGGARGADAVRTILVGIRSFYERQEFAFVGPYGDHGLIEDYTAEVRGEPISCVVLVESDAGGQVEHIVANYRPRSSVLRLAGL